MTCGSLGTVQLAFLASAAACPDVVNLIHPSSIYSSQAEALRRQEHDLSPPEGNGQQRLKVWHSLRGLN